MVKEQQPSSRPDDGRGEDPTRPEMMPWSLRQTRIRQTRIRPWGRPGSSLPVFRVLLVLLVCAIALLSAPAPAAGGGGHGGSTAEHGPAKSPEKPKEKPKDKKPKEKKHASGAKCPWPQELVLDVEGHALHISQDMLKLGVGQYTIDRHHVMIDARLLNLMIQTPDGAWFRTGLTRMQNPDEECIGFYAGTLMPMSGSQLR
jgi:hypothetical protein